MNNKQKAMKQEARSFMAEQFTVAALSGFRSFHYLRCPEGTL